MSVYGWEGFEADMAPPGFIQCKTCRILRELPDEGYAAVVGALEDPLKSGAGIARALRKRGIQVGELSIQRHRTAGHSNER